MKEEGRLLQLDSVVYDNASSALILLGKLLDQHPYVLLRGGFS